MGGPDRRRERAGRGRGDEGGGNPRMGGVGAREEVKGRGLVSSPSSSRHALSCINPESGPWLFYQHGKGYKTHTFVGMSDGSCDIRSVRELRRKTILASPDGWILAWDETTRRCSLLNPITSARHDLPDMPSGVDCINFVTSSSLADGPESSCRVVVAVTPCPSLLSCRVGGDGQWTPHSGHFGKGFVNEILSVQGRFYYLSGSSIWSVDLDSPTVFTNLIPDWRDERWATMSSHYVEAVESDGDLYTVHSNHSRLTTTHVIYVFKLDWERKEWTEVRDIGDRAFFVCSDCSLSCSAGPSSGFRNNCIYFVVDDDMKLYCCDLEDGTTSVVLPFLGIRKPSATPLWINRPI